jgi:molybdopterin synthase catalytic subunit
MILHRYGRLRPGDPIMMVATAARHRADAFAAAEFLMDYLKSRAPFWKKEVTADGATWVAPGPRTRTRCRAGSHACG